MQQYIYGNIEQKGYVYLSSDPGFFKDTKRMAVMQHLICYDAACRHGNLSAENHQCFWMVTTDLDIPGEEKRLFLQASGADPFRSGIYVHGYMSDVGDSDLYGPKLLKLIRTKFLSLSEVEAIKKDDSLVPLGCDDLPTDDRVQPLDLEPDVMRNVLAVILRNKRVIVRLPDTGANAMRKSREFLLAIYQRLPYELRRTNGFLTGASAAKVHDEVNELPAAVKIILMDGDADVSGIESDSYQVFIDLKDPDSKAEAMSRENRGKRPVNARLMNFLIEQKPEALNDFFGFCKSLTDAAVEISAPDAGNYALFLFFYTIWNKRNEKITDDQIRFCAANFCSKKLQDQIKKILYEKISSVLPADRLAEYLVGAAFNYEELALFGHLEKEEKEQLESGQYSEGSVKDAHAALTLRMTESLLKYYPWGTRELLLSRLTDHFVKQGCQAYSSLSERRPTQETVKSLKQLNLTVPAGGKALPAQLRASVYASLQQKKQTVMQMYVYQRNLQYEQGKDRIQKWSFVSNSMAAGNVENLYCELKENFYLHDELLNDGEKGSWNDCIADGIAYACANSAPETMEHYKSLLDITQNSCECFQKNGGKFSAEQNARISQEVEKWQRILALNDQQCQSVDQLLQLFEKVDQTGMHSTAAGMMKRTFAAAAARSCPGAEDILSNATRLCQHAADPLERKLLCPVVGASPNLTRVSGDLPLDSVLARLKSTKKLEEAQLFEGEIDFLPWHMRQKASVLLVQLEGLQRYQLGVAEPLLGNRYIRKWAAEKLQRNMDLMFLLAKEDPTLGNDLIKLLAQKQNPVTNRQIRELYLAGWTEQVLCTGGGTQMSAAWETAIQAVFPLWPELPEPISAKLTLDEGESRILLIAEPILLCLAGSLPIVLSTVLGLISLSVCIWSAAALAVGAAGCVAAGFLVPQKVQKTLLRWLAISLLPGIIAALAAMLLIMISVF